MTTKIRFLICVVFTSFFLSCETIELDLLENPNQLQPDQFDPDLLLNNIQLNLAAFFEQISDEGMELTRMRHSFATDFFSGYGPGTLNGPYATFYAGMLPDIQLLLTQTDEFGLSQHEGIAKIIEAYVLITLVDHLGDIPLDEANQGLENPNPGLTDEEDVYAFAQDLLTSAIVDLQETPLAGVQNDFFYPLVDGGADTAMWATVARTLLLKTNLQTRLVNPNAAQNINQLLADGVIDVPGEDFQFAYSTLDQNPDSRHPIFSANYDNGVNSYQSNHYMNLLVNGKSIRDPRTRFYFYRQSNDAAPTNAAAIACIQQPRPPQYSVDDAFCFVIDETSGEGLWLGRDTFNADGIGPDNALRANWGVYPVGGRFDDDSFAITADRDQGAFGAGISPIMLSSYVSFMQAEAALVLNTTGNPADLLEEGIRRSMNKVLNFSPDATTEELVNEALANVDVYVDEVLANYNNATSDDERLAIIIEEYYIALYGNGIEMYNTYRRTGHPRDLQPPRTPNPGDFVRTFFYPMNAVVNNSNLNQKPDQQIPVFWDTNPPGFVD